MFLDIYISADAALICGAPRVGRFRVPISSALRDKIRDRGYVEIAASYVRENPDGVPTHYEALHVHGLTDDALLEGVAAVHATNREMLAVADEIIERQSTAALPSRPKGHVLTRVVEERVTLAERVQSARATYAKLASAVDDSMRERYCEDLIYLKRNVAVAAFGAKADAVIEEAQAFLDARQRQREAEEARRKREADERYEADKRGAEEKAKVRRAQRRAFAVLLDNALGEHTALVSRFDDDLLPESDLWCAIRLWLSRLLTRDALGEDLHHEASCTHYGHDVRWKLSDDVKLGRPEYGRFRDYKERCDELIPQLAAVGLELTYKVQRGSWTCRDCDESGAPKLLSITVGTPSEDWTLDMAL